jgi:hypothetical protein
MEYMSDFRCGLEKFPEKARMHDSTLCDAGQTEIHSARWIFS